MTWDWTSWLLDPDFDEADDALGGLTLAQIRDPVRLEFGCVQDLHRQALDNKRRRIELQYDRLQHLTYRLRSLYKKRLWRADQKLQRLAKRFEQLVKWQVKARRQPRSLWLPQIGNWMQRRMRFLLGRHRKRLHDLSLRLHRWELHSTSRYPVFWFNQNHKCDRCIPYNGHHTPNYWFKHIRPDPW